MSDISSPEDTIQSSERQNDKEENSFCRDFARGFCNRKFCKYKHEQGIRLTFCHDYQNLNYVCPWPNCKFIHCSIEEVDEFKKTGQMPYQILVEATRKGQFQCKPPICTQYKNGNCKRSHCKYRHISRSEAEKEFLDTINDYIENRVHENYKFIGSINKDESRNNFHPYDKRRRRNDSFDDYMENGFSSPTKRRMPSPHDFISRDLHFDFDRLRPAFKGYISGTPPPPGVFLNRSDPQSMSLEEENNFLHKEIAQLKKKVQDLTATNEFLLDQNATLRISNKQNTVNMSPAVTLTNNNNQQQPQVIRTVTASVAAVPVSLATVTTGNPVSITGCPTVSIASPAQILAPSQQILVTANQAQQLALATSTQQAQHMANQQLALANTQSQQLTLASNQQLTTQAQQQLANQQLTSQAQQLALANTTQQLTSQAQQLALANPSQQLNNQAQQIALASAPQQLTSSQAQQLASLANTTQQLTVANVQPQQLALAAANTNQQLLAAQQNLAASTQQMEQLHRNNRQITAAINPSQNIAMSNASQSMVSYPIMTQSLSHPLGH